MKAPLGLILAGGRGRRLGGVQKSDLVIRGETLLDMAISRLSRQVADFAISSHSAVASDYHKLADIHSGHLGPLAGIFSGLIWAQEHGASHIVSVAVDCPYFPCDLVPQLILASESHAFGLATTFCDDRFHPVFGLWPVAYADDLERYLSGGGRKVMEWLDRHDPAIARFPKTSPASFFNINTKADLEEARNHIN